MRRIVRSQRRPFLSSVIGDAKAYGKRKDDDANNHWHDDHPCLNKVVRLPELLVYVVYLAFEITDGG